MRKDGGFFIGLSNPAHAGNFERVCISINQIFRRKKKIECAEVLVDSGAFTEISTHGHYRSSVKKYAESLRRLKSEGVVNIVAAVAQDYMCEPFILAKTGLTVEEHQRLTIERYDDLVRELEGSGIYVMPVLQGYAPADYARHVRMYGDRLKPGMWVGVGSVCKRNGSPERIHDVLSAIHAVRSDLLLHGFGIKQTSLKHAGVRALLDTADSMAWSYAARREGRDRNSWKEAKGFSDKVSAIAARAPEPWQLSILPEFI